MKNQFKRGKRVAFIGLPIVFILVIWISFEFGQGARPTGAILGIFAVVFGFIAVLLYNQKLDLRDARAADAKAAALAGPKAIKDPTRATDYELLAALSVGPSGDVQTEAHAEIWDFAESSWRSGVIVCILIPIAVLPWMLFQWAWSVLIGGAVIGLYALFLSARLVMPGGGVDQAYAASERVVAPLGLEGVERPRVAVRPRFGQPAGGLRHEMRGAHVLTGKRHGRTVTVTQADGRSETVVIGPVPKFEVAAKSERLKVVGDAPAGVEEVLKPLRASSLWQGVEASGGPGGITVSRKRDKGRGWLCDLWLAETLADRLART